MPTTANGLPYPDLNATPDVPYWLQQLADALELRGYGKRAKWGTYATGALSGGFATITHNAGFTPTAVVVTLSTAGLQCKVDNLTSTTFRIQIINSDGSASASAQTFYAFIGE